MKPHILLIDDDEDELNILSDTLYAASINCICTFSTSPIDALNIIQHIYPDLIFIDYNMPKMNGVQCISELRKVPHIDHIPVILYSNQIDEPLRKKALEAGATDCLKKTSDLSGLIRSLRELLMVIH